MDFLIKIVVGVVTLLAVLFTVGFLVIKAPIVLVLAAFLVIAYMIGSVIVEEFF